MRKDLAFICQRPDVSVDGGHRAKTYAGTDLPVAWGYVVLLPVRADEIQNLTLFLRQSSHFKTIILLHIMTPLIRKELSQMFAIHLLPVWQSENTRGSEKPIVRLYLRFAIA